MKQKKILVAFVLSLCTFTVVQAQENDFDLGCQRSEIQSITPVPGKKIDHHGLVINPTPRHLRLTSGNTVDISAGVHLIQPISKRKLTSDYRNELTFLSLSSKGFPLQIQLVEKPLVVDVVSKKQANVDGAYSLTVSPKEIRFQAANDAGVFYAIQTLRQLIESPIAEGGRKLPCLEINDAPVFPYRGVVEGFYGMPWSHAVRLSLIEFYGRHKLNTYIYGPKDDPYHSSPSWRLPYPEREQRNIKELVEACRRNRVDFVWAIHPGKDIKWNEEDYQNLVRKFNLMYADGVRSFAIFFDDISGEGTNPNKQVELLNRLTKEFVKAKGDVSPLIICPTDYSKLWAKADEDGPLSIYGRTLDPSVRVFWTGDVVCSDVTKETLDWVDSRIKRPAFFWWNYAVTDYVRNLILQGPVYGLDTSLTNKDMCGLVSNPMEHGEASKLSLYSVADYTWNPAAYNPIDSWERGLEVMMPHAKEAYRTFAIHSADTETGYRRDESWDTETFRLADYTKEKRDKLYEEFERVVQVPAKIEAGCNDTLLLQELQPWLKEFGKLGMRGKKALELMDLYRSEDASSFWKAYVKNLMSNKDKQAYEAHKSGTMKLQPFYECAMKDLGEAFYERQSGKKAFSLHGTGTYRNIGTTQSELMLDGDSATFYTSGESQKAGDWIGVSLPEPMPIREVHILQGRNSKDDTDFFDHAAIEYSVDGKVWKPLLTGLHNQYDILWKAERPIEARYIRLVRLDSKRTNWAAVRSFTVVPENVAATPFIENNGVSNDILNAFDHQPSTIFKSIGDFSFKVPHGTTAFTFLLSLPTDGSVRLCQYDKRNRLKAEYTSTSPFFTVDVAKNVTRIEVIGKANVFEIIPKSQH
ncbi:beta-N-acetylglucosaminidase [Prevotella sp. HMSC077E09]|uniref:beta-N-acetylglucosaminidase domain-containing protein n=1 Tax=Prevotella sp. HMSC077E09 TaxID=1739487 RepID=UPI0008A2C8B3|nr:MULTISPECIES: beta-N-acetylglucosaminidase domain-containing protein [unclassified Prevotella]OFO75245.1 beta-N-acetylglucosaminidase [Prevotella sp. HMSC077E08]OFP54402.1 beta-N-acetylglucosaminidase [Prevotella sp. HMSC077E09]